jgi:flagellum-specific peptidoglycan hydrolase FlgJ
MKKILFVIVLGIISLSLYAPDNKIVDILIVDPIHYVSLNDVEVLLKEFKVKHYKIVLAQIRLETGNLSSFICKNNKNLMGMKYPIHRETTAIGGNYGYAVYKTYRDCVKDYLLWQQSCYKGGDYITFLTCRYAEDPNYIKKIKEMI